MTETNLFDPDAYPAVSCYMLQSATLHRSIFRLIYSYSRTARCAMLPYRQFMLRRQRQRMSDLRFQRQLQFEQKSKPKFPVVFSRRGRVPISAPPFNWYAFFCQRYGFFPKFRKLPVVSGRLLTLRGWRFYQHYWRDKSANPVV